MTSSYPRDMIGYGAEPPHAQWPGDARLALQFVINYEEGAENAILHGDPAAEAFLSEWMGATPTLGLRNMNMESLYEYGSRAGFWRLYRTFTERRLPVTVYVETYNSAMRFFENLGFQKTAQDELKVLMRWDPENQGQVVQRVTGPNG